MADAPCAPAHRRGRRRGCTLSVGVVATTRDPSTGANSVLHTIAVVLIALWLLGLITSYTMGGFIHVLLVVAIVVVLVRIINGRALV